MQRVASQEAEEINVALFIFRPKICKMHLKSSYEIICILGPNKFYSVFGSFHCGTYFEKHVFIAVLFVYFRDHRGSRGYQENKEIPGTR